MGTRTDTASKMIKAPPETIYRAFLTPEAITTWRPPKGMSCKVYAFNAVEGGAFRMAFIYNEADQGANGKTTAQEDVFSGYFVELVPNERIVEAVTFQSDDPAFSGEMRLITLLAPVEGGTRVTFRAENVPEGIRPEDHARGMQSSLENLAAYTQ